METVTMAERTQINFRIDNTLLAAIREYCEKQDLTQTDFITHALKSALGISPVTYNESSNEAIQQLSERLLQLEQRLAENLDNSASSQLEDELETKLDTRISEVNNKLDECIADAINKLYSKVDERIAEQIDRRIGERIEVTATSVLDNNLDEDIYSLGELVA